MTQGEFLEKFREALENDLSGPIVEENIDYYRSYIAEEIRKGKTESEVISDLGDPWILARSIIDMTENQEEYREGSGAEFRKSKKSDERGAGRMKTFRLQSWWKKLLFVLGMIGVLLIVFTVVAGVLHFLAVILVPVLLIVLVIRLVDGMRR